MGKNGKDKNIVEIKNLEESSTDYWLSSIGQVQAHDAVVGV